eukprot:CAMPEP_0172151248 /NCGR_PEP_ID=MMETSP1050-20130122/117_1 /TAXON_ID=233186 /ORGANISM="Cryptomonas curvata, Strain CCAP979/52" /LENGTH=45 /DNA_ID= /DNA_START= /DNA_END= /DNA_ORIENTATION=
MANSSAVEFGNTTSVMDNVTDKNSSDTLFQSTTGGMDNVTDTTAN